MKIKTIFSQKQLNNQVCSNAVITDIISNDVQKIKEMIDSRQPNINTIKKFTVKIKTYTKVYH